MCWGEKGGSKVLEKVYMQKIWERQWGTNKGYVMKWKL